MKRIFGVMCMAAVLAIGSTSCQKNKETSSFTFALPTVEGFQAGDEKAYIDIADGSAMKWWDGDQMMVYSVDATNTTPITAVYTAQEGCQGSTLAHFRGDNLVEGSYGYFAFYPAEKAGRVEENNRAYFNVGPTQNYDSQLDFAGTSMAGRAFMDPKGVVAASTCQAIHGDATVNVKHIFGFANVRVKDLGENSGQKKLKKVTITDPNMNLTGEMSIVIPELTDERLSALQTLGNNYYNNGDIDTYMPALNSTLQEMGYESAGDGHSVTLDCSNADITITNINKFFIIPLRPGALLKDFVVTITYDNDETKEFAFNGKQYIIRPGYFSNIQCTW